MSDQMPPQAENITESIRLALQAERDKTAVDRLALAEEKLKLVDKEREADARLKPSWWADWFKPSTVFAAAATLFGAFQVYQSDKAAIQSRFQEQSAALVSIATEVHSNLQAATERANKYIPTVEADHASTEAQTLINAQNNDRMQNVATSLADLRRSVEALRDAVQKTHEELMISEAKRQRESRNSVVGPGDMSTGPAR